MENKKVSLVFYSVKNNDRHQFDDMSNDEKIEGLKKIKDDVNLIIDYDYQDVDEDNQSVVADIDADFLNDWDEEYDDSYHDYKENLKSFSKMLKMKYGEFKEFIMEQWCVAVVGDSKELSNKIKQ